MQSTVSFVLDGKIQTIDFNAGYTPTTTVLNFLRATAAHKGVKEGCAEGDCGACTVVLGELNEHNKVNYKAVDSCLVFLPMLHGKQLITVENLSSVGVSSKILHPVQEAMVGCNGSQCGYCTPGIVMSLLALYKQEEPVSKEAVEDALTGNLCRCTGYKPIIDAAMSACGNKDADAFTKDENHIVSLLQNIKKQETELKIDGVQQKYLQPKTIANALMLKQQLPEAILLNGATDIALRVTKRHELLANIIDLSSVEELTAFKETNESFIIGAGVKLEDIKARIKNELPALHEALTVFGSKQIRSLATLGGNLGSASPIGDTIPVLMAYNSDIVLCGNNGERKVNINDFILGYRKTECKPDEIITSIIIPKPTLKTIVKFYKVSKRKDLDISTVSAGYNLVLNNNVVESITLAYGGMAATTKRASAAESYLVGKEWTRENAEGAMTLIEEEFTPISDARSGAKFRSLVSKNLLLKFWSETHK